MAEVKWIKITTNIFDDEKIKLIDILPDRDALLVIWFKLLAMAGKTNDDGLVYVMKEMPTNDEILATVFNRPINTVRLALDTFKRFGMIEIDNHVNIINWEKHQNVEGLDKIREQARLRQRKFKEKKKKLALEEKGNIKVTLPVTEGNATEEELDIELDKELDKEKELKENIEDYFVSAWKLYPNKKGKGSIKQACKNKIYKLGDEFTRCITRYINYVNSKRATDFPDLKYQNGSTFFNSGYVDFLDENYQDIEIAEESNIDRMIREEEEKLMKGVN